MEKSLLRFVGTCDGAAPGVARYVTVVGLCYPLDSVCSVLASDSACIREAEAQHQLIALEGTLLFPVWQFPYGQLLPHLASSIAALPLARMGPEGASLWFTRPRRALRGRCAARWLQRGGDPQLVHSLAELRAARPTGTAETPAPRARVVPAG